MYGIQTGLDVFSVFKRDYRQTVSREFLGSDRPEWEDTSNHIEICMGPNAEKQ